MISFCQGNAVCTLTGHSDRVTSVAASHDGQLVTGALDKNLKLWQPRSETAESAQCESHDHMISATLLTRVNNELVALTASRCVE